MAECVPAPRSRRCWHRPARASCRLVSPVRGSIRGHGERLSELRSPGSVYDQTEEGAVTLWQDVRYGFRMLAASPGFTTVAVLSLAIGIGANCAIFSFADALLLRPLPVARPGDVLTVGSRSSIEALNASSLVSSYRDYVDIRDRNKSFDGLAAFSYLTVGFSNDPTATPKLKMGMMASSNLLPLMGVEPTIGRTFRADEDQVPGRDAVVVLGRTMWEQEFASDAGVLGRSVRINGV